MPEYDRRHLSPSQRNYSNWPDIDPWQLPEEDRLEFWRRKRAVTRYLDGDSLVRIEQDTGFRRDQVGTFVSNCLQVHDDGRIWGFRALVPGTRQTPYERKKPVPFLDPEEKAGYAGALGQLFREYPTIYEELVAYIKNTVKGETGEVGKRVQSTIHVKFLKLCKEAGLGPSDYPFNTTERARRSLATFVNNLFIIDPESMLRAYQGPAMAGRWGNKPSSPKTPVSRPFERLEFDAHRIDAIWTIEFLNPWGGVVTAVLERLWLLELMDVYSRATLGYHVSVKKKFDAGDIMACFEHALMPWRKTTLTIPGLEYPEGAGFPSGLVPGCERALWDEIYMDNDWANLAFDVTDSLMDVVGCNVNFGTVRVLNRRPFVERFFGTLEEHGFHRLFNTTGSKPGDPKRQSPEKNARWFHMTYQDLIEIMEVELAAYNGKEGHTGLGGRSPLQTLEFFCADENNLIRTLPPEDIDELEWLGHRHVGTIRGNVKKVRRPYVEYMKGTYTSLILADSPGLIGRKVTLLVKTHRDIRRLKAILDDGTDIGYLEVTGSWALSEHNLYQRKLCNKLIREKKIPSASVKNPIEAAREYFASKAGQSKRDATFLSNFFQAPWPPYEASTSIPPGISEKEESNQDSLPNTSKNDRSEEEKGGKYSGKPVFWDE